MAGKVVTGQAALDCAAEVLGSVEVYHAAAQLESWVVLWDSG